MSDMLVKLYEIKDFSDDILPADIKIKRAIAPEKHIITSWVRENFSAAWADECEIALSNTPTKCFIAYTGNEIIGFACYDATAIGFFGPIGVLDKYRKTGIGKALLLKALTAMKYAGYAYAIIGWAGPVDFFKKNCKATIIENSDKSVYEDILKNPKK